jgi:hypothetical protein
MELRPIPRSGGSGRRRSSDRVSLAADGSAAAPQLRDVESGLLYSPPPGGAVKGAWPQLAGYTDPRDGGRKWVGLAAYLGHPA